MYVLCITVRNVFMFNTFMYENTYVRMYVSVIGMVFSAIRLYTSIKKLCSFLDIFDK